MNDTEKLHDFLTPNLLKEKLILASCFIAVFENFKSTILNDVKYFYWSGLQDGIEEFKYYERDVLSKVQSNKNRTIRATLLWLKDHGAISETERIRFKCMTDRRDELGHNMFNAIYDGLPTDMLDIYFEMITLFTKITKWWIKEIELPTSGEYTVDQYDKIDWNEVTSANLEFITMMTDIAFTGNEEYLKTLQEL